MSRIDNVIADIKNVDKNGHAWIFDTDGNIRNDVICGDVIPLLEELKEYEVEFNDEEHEKRAIDLILTHATDTWNTYNWNANISHDIDVAELEICGYTYMAIMVHRYGDVRGNYTDRFIVKFDDICDFYELESRMQYKTIMDGKYTCGIDISSEGYNVWNNETQTDVGEFYEIEVADLLDAINKRA